MSRRGNGRDSQFAVRKDTLSYQLVIVTRIGKARFDLDRAGNGSGSTAFYTANNCSLPEGRDPNRSSNSGSDCPFLSARWLFIQQGP